MQEDLTSMHMWEAKRCQTVEFRMWGIIDFSFVAYGH